MAIETIESLRRLTENTLIQRKTHLRKEARKRQNNVEKLEEKNKLKATEMAEKIISQVWSTLENSAKKGSFWGEVMVLKYGEDFRAPRQIVKTSSGSFNGIFNLWLRDLTILDPRLLVGAGKIVYDYCRDKNLSVLFHPHWVTRNYCEGEAYERDKVFSMVVSWR